jgi:hypothetical protein
VIGSVEIKKLPIRLAFLVDPKSTPQIREAIRLCSSLWGGAYFPILPLYRRMPATWADKRFKLKRPSAESVFRGYLAAFDPDVLVQVSDSVPPFIAGGRREIVPAAEIWQPIENTGPLVPKFGIGVFELWDGIFEKYFRYKAKFPVRVVLPSLPEELTLFWASVLGELPPTLMPIVEGHFRELLEIEQVAFTPDKLAEMMAANVLFPRRVTQYALKHRNRAGFRSRASVFFLDATNPDDMVDFWNLRALGREVIAAPKQLQAEPMLRDLVVSFLKSHRQPWPHNPSVFDFASTLRANIGETLFVP